MANRKINQSLNRILTPPERRRLRQIIAELPEHQWNTRPKQEQIVEYIQAIEERNELIPVVKEARREAIRDSNDPAKLAKLNQWNSMVGRVDRKLTALRNAIGLNAKKEADLEKSLQAKGAPKGGHEIKPWLNT